MSKLLKILQENMKDSGIADEVLSKLATSVESKMSEIRTECENEKIALKEEYEQKLKELEQRIDEDHAVALDMVLKRIDEDYSEQLDGLMEIVESTSIEKVKEVVDVIKNKHTKDINTLKESLDEEYTKELEQLMEQVDEHVVYQLNRVNDKHKSDINLMIENKDKEYSKKISLLEENLRDNHLNLIVEKVSDFLDKNLNKSFERVNRESEQKTELCLTLENKVSQLEAELLLERKLSKMTPAKAAYVKNYVSKCPFDQFGQKLNEAVEAYDKQSKKNTVLLNEQHQDRGSAYKIVTESTASTESTANVAVDARIAQYANLIKK